VHHTVITALTISASTALDGTLVPLLLLVSRAPIDCPQFRASTYQLSKVVNEPSACTLVANRAEAPWHWEQSQSLLADY